MPQSIVNELTPRALYTGLSTIFNDAMKTVSNSYATTAMVINSTAAGMDYGWVTNFPRMRKWVGDKVIKGLATKSYYVKNEDYEATIAVKRNDLEDGELGMLAANATQQAYAAQHCFNNLIDTVKNDAFTNPGMDGLSFYNTNHSMTGSDGIVRTYSNRSNVALSAASIAAVSASYGLARTTIAKYTDEDGQPLGIIPTILEVPPALEAVALTIANSQELYDKSPNPYRGTCTVLVNPGLTSDTAWFLHVGNYGAFKPFILQIRKQPTFISSTSPDSDTVLLRGQYIYSVEARAAGAYGLSQLSFGSTGV